MGDDRGAIAGGERLLIDDVVSDSHHLGASVEIRLQVLERDSSGGQSGICGNTAWIARKCSGPPVEAGKSLTMSAPSRCAARISPGVKPPISARRPASCASFARPGTRHGETRNCAPASMQRLAVSRSRTVPAPASVFLAIQLHEGVVTVISTMPKPASRKQSMALSVSSALARRSTGITRCAINPGRRSDWGSTARPRGRR